MGSKDELKEIDFKNGMCYYFDDIKGVRDILLVISYLVKKKNEYFTSCFYLTLKKCIASGYYCL